MACASSPTATLFGSSTSESESTSFSKSVSSLPGSVTTLHSTTCVATTTGADNSTSCAETSTINQVQTIPGGQTTVQVPVVITVPVVQTFPTQTLFSNCDTTPSITTPSATTPSATTPTTTTTTTSSTSTSTPPRTSIIVTVTTPPPIVKTIQASITLPNGSKVQTTTIVTSSLPPSTVHETTTVSSFQPVQSSDGASHSRVEIAPIVGGAVGGFFALLFLVVVVWLILRKRGSWDDIFEKDTDGPVNFHPSRLVRDPNMSVDMRSEMEPKPYQYGLVGPSSTPPFASPPGSPTDYYYPQHIVPDNGQTHAHTHSRNRSFSPDNNQYMHDNRRSFSPEYNQHTRQYSVDRIETQHNRRPSATSLLYSPLQLPTTAISPEPSVASVYSQATSRPGYDRDNSSGSGSRPPTGNSRHSDGSAVSRSSTRNSTTGPAGPRRLRRPSKPDDFGSAMPPPAEHGARPLSADSQGSQGKHRRPSNDAPVSPRTLTLTNWNPSTDAISFDAAAQPPRKSVGSREQPRGQQNNRSSVLSTGANASPRAGPSSSANVIIHTDGGTVGGDMHASNDVKQMPAEEPPAYSG